MHSQLLDVQETVQSWPNAASRGVGTLEVTLAEGNFNE
jgi:hypothetical protein